MSLRVARERQWHSVYILKDEHGAILYVGCTAYLNSRIVTHRRKEWGHMIAEVEVYAEVVGRSNARTIELDLIHKHDPPYNDQGTEKSRERSREQWRARKASAGAHA